MSKTLKNLALEVYNGKNVMFNEVSGETALKNAILDACGGKLTYNSFQRHKLDIFEILGEVIELPMQQTEKEILGDLVKTSQIPLGDKKEITLKNKKLLRVAAVARGTSDVRRQRLTGLDRITVETATYAIKVYEDLELLLSDRISFSDFVDAINKSYEVAVAKMVNKCFTNSVNTLGADSKITSSGGVDEEELMELCNKISAKNGGSQVKIYGAKTALAKVASAVPTHMVTDAQKNEYASVRHFGNFYNIQLVEIAQMYDDKLQPVVDEHTLYIVATDNLIEVVYEGSPIVIEGNGENRGDMQIEMYVSQRIGCAAIFNKYFGAYIIA